MHRRDKLVGIREVPSAVSTAAQDKLQPWQAVFAIFTYAITQFEMSETNTLILVGMIAATLGFVMRSTYKHKESVKEVVAPWLLERVLEILGDYLKPTLPETPEGPIATPDLTREQLIERLESLGAEVD